MGKRKLKKAASRFRQKSSCWTRSSWRKSLIFRLLAGELEVEVLERAAVHLEALELDAVGQGLRGQLVEHARRLLGRHHDLRAVAAVADLDRRVAGEELLGRAGADDLAAAQDGDAVGESLRLLHVVRREEDALPQGAQVADRLPRLPPRGRVEAGRRLVEEDELRVADEREGEVEPAELAA